MNTKQTKMILIILAVLMTQDLSAVSYDMIIKKSDGTIIRSAVTEIDSMIFLETGTVTDIDGNTYKTVKIGDQWWMAENLRTTRYSDFTEIPNVIDNAAWTELNTGAYCYYDNDSNSYAGTYGALYNWYALNDARNIAPEGWHVPTDAEWTTLVNYLGGVSVAGGKLKEINTLHWNSPNTGATNEAGFAALPGGLRSAWAGTFMEMGNFTFFWSASEKNTTDVWCYYLMYNETYFISSGHSKGFAYSVRCVKDETP